MSDQVVFVSDFFLSDCQGGAEMVDDTIIKTLKLTTARSRDLQNVDPYKLYILSNTFQLQPFIRGIFKIYQNYIIFEHDYKIHTTRQPNLFPGNIVPVAERTNYDYYQNARCTFLQSSDHEQCFKDNQVPGVFKTFHTSIWSKEEINLLKKHKRSEAKINKVAIMDHYHPAKGKDRAIAYCKENNLEFELIPKMDRNSFYEKLSQYSALAYFPIVKESFCRLVVEARAMGLSVYSSNDYGVTTEEWYRNIDKNDIIDYIEAGSKAVLTALQQEINA